MSGRRRVGGRTLRYAGEADGVWQVGARRLGHRGVDQRAAVVDGIGPVRGEAQQMAATVERPDAVEVRRGRRRARELNGRCGRDPSGGTSCRAGTGPRSLCRAAAAGGCIDGCRRHPEEQRDHSTRGHFRRCRVAAVQRRQASADDEWQLARMQAGLQDSSMSESGRPVRPRSRTSLTGKHARVCSLCRRSLRFACWVQGVSDRSEDSLSPAASWPSR